MKILVTGASGQDGVLLIKHILHSNPEVKIIALSRNEKKFYLNLFYAGGAKLVSNFMNSGIFITCDITDRSQINQQKYKELLNQPAQAAKDFKPIFISDSSNLVK